MEGKLTRLTPMVPVPVMPVTFTVYVAPEPVMEEMVPLATDPVESKLKSAVSTPITGWLKVTVKEAELVTAPLPVVMDKAFGKAGEKGTAGTILSSR